MFSQKRKIIFSIPQPDHQGNNHAEANLHNCTNCGNIFRAKDHFPKHVESLHCVALVLPVSCVATPRGATAKLAQHLYHVHNLSFQPVETNVFLASPQQSKLELRKT